MKIILYIFLVVLILIIGALYVPLLIIGVPYTFLLVMYRGIEKLQEAFYKVFDIIDATLIAMTRDHNAKG